MNPVMDGILLILFYSGPFLPWMGSVLLADKKRIRRLPFKKTFIVAGIVHVLAFVPVAHAAKYRRF